MNKKLIICLNSLSIILILLIINCGKENRIELLSNSSVEQGTSEPDSWRNLKHSDCTFEWSTECYVSHSHSLKISRDISSKTVGYGRWVQTTDVDIPTGKELTLSVSIKLEDVTGNGVFFELLCYDNDTNDPPKVHKTSTEQIYLLGTKDWERYSIKLLNTPPNIESIMVFLCLNSTGTVYFDDITLSYIE